MSHDAKTTAPGRRRAPEAGGTRADLTQSADQTGVAPEAPPAGTAIGRFEAVRTIGSGGMGVVIEAHDPELDRRIAIKLMRPSLAGEERSATRLQREAQAMAKLAHPNVVAVFDAGRWNEQTFIAMELVEGETLRAWQETARPWLEVVRLYLGAGRGLGAAHDAGLVHRDFKPDNVLVGGDGRPRVTDFGLVAGDREAPDRELSGPLSESLTIDGVAMGTPAYMSPEHWAGDGIDARSDQFSFCVALWEAAFGARPFRGATSAELRARVLRGEIAPVEPRRAPAWLEAALRRGLARDPALRWPGMAALIGELERRMAPSRRGPAIAIVAGVAALAAGTAIVVIATRPAPAASCPDPRPRLAGIWDRARADAISKAFVATGHPEAERAARRVAAALDRHADAWVSTAKDACEATRVRKTAPPAALEARDACLDDLRTELRELTGAFAVVTTRDAVDQADAALDGLSSVDRCAASAADAVDPEVRAARADVVRLMSAGRARMFVGDYDGARSRADEALAIERTVDDPPTLLRALFAVGQMAERQQDWKASAAAFQEGARVAFAMQDHDATAQMYGELMTILAEGQSDVPGALALRPLVEAELEAAGHPPLTELRVGEALAITLQLSGDAAGAHAISLHNLELARRMPGESSTLVQAILNVGRGSYDLRRWADARASAEEALQLSEAVFGPEHPHTADALHLAAQAAKELDDLDAAQAYIDRALAIREARFGPEDTRTLATQLTVANLRKRRGDLAGARALLEQRLAVLERSPSATKRQLMLGLWSIAQIRVEQGDHEGALPYFERGFAAAEAVSGHDSFDYAKIENDLAESLRAQKRHREALPHYEHILAVVRTAMPSMVPDFLKATAQCQRDLGNQKAARALEREAAALAATP